MLDHRAADLARRAGDDVEHAFRHTGLERETSELDRSERRHRRRLQHDRASGSQSRRDLPRRQQQRKVPRHDRADHADRLAHGVREVARDRRRQRVAIILRGRAGVELERVDDGAHLALGRADGLAVVAHFEQRQIVGSLRDELRQLVDDLRTARRRHRRPLPGVEGAPRRRNGRIYVVARRVGDVGELRPGRRIAVVVGSAVRGVAPLPADEELRFRHDRGRAHPPRLLPDALEYRCDALPDADAHRCKAVAAAAPA